jgi:prolipoprotein diacylglyceryltransferase
MRPLFVAWLLRHGWPGWLAPDYAVMVGVAGIASAVLILRLAERDGARVDIQARALLLAYVGALLGGYVFEWLRAVPEALAAQSLDPIVFAGRAAYGGLLFGLLCPILYLRRRGQPVTGFLDRATVAMGISFGSVRIGCFLEGCDYGVPTASALGVRFPGGSLAADAHAAAGFVPFGEASLPVHPTQLYESAIGLAALGFAVIVLRTGRRDGTAFTAWMTVYALGRFLIERLRDDADRGTYGPFSTAQWVSLAVIVAAIVVTASRAKATRGAFQAVALVLVLASPRAALAQAPPDPPPAAAPPEPPPSPAPPKPPASAAQAPAQPISPSAPQPVMGTPEEPPPPPVRILAVRVAAVGAITAARPDVPSGTALEIDVLYRLRLASQLRLDVGLEGRRFRNAEARHDSLGLVGELAVELGARFEIVATLVPHHTWFYFDSPFFTNTNAYGVRFATGVQVRLGSRVMLGASPAAFNVTSSDTVGVITQWEPRMWGGLLF